MNRINITYYIYRSNPLSERTISVPEHFRIRDLMASFCLAMGIPVACGEMCELISIAPEEAGGRKGVEEAVPLDMDLSVSAWIDRSKKSKTGMSQDSIRGKAYIYADEKTRSVGELTFLFQVEDSNIDSSHIVEEESSQTAITKETEESLKAAITKGTEESSANSFDAIPLVLDACGWHLPAGVFRIGQVNEIWQSLDENKSVQMNGITYIASRMTYDEKKTRGLICSHFAPELAPMLHTEMAAPWSVILEAHKVSELEELCSIHRAYCHTKKKANLLNSLLQRLPAVINPQRIFEEIDYPEYMIFRSILLNGTPDKSFMSELQHILPALVHYGMVVWTKKTGLLFLEELVSYYEDWFDTQREKRYRAGKFLTYVLNGCGYYYGIFSKEMGWNLIAKIFSDYVTWEEYDDFWNTMGKHRRDLKIKICDIHSQTPGWAYDYELWDEMKKPMLYYRALAGDESPRYIPEKEEFEDMCFHHQDCPGTEIFDFMRKLSIFDTRHYGYNGVLKVCLNAIRIGLSDREVAQKVIHNTGHYFYRSDYWIDLLVPAIEAIRPHVPQILLYGYMEKQIEACKVPDTARKRYEVIVKEAEEEEARRKREEQERKKKAKKEAAKKRRRY